ncbi:MAG: PspC family transcriptional regulator [Flavobacteriaceae bacterium]|nr:MAG: PspC family transcriptional regulator [Flavobacteriaceae bacterium]
MEKIRTVLENNGFEVVSRLADRLGIRVNKLRLLFIYLSLATAGLMVGVYLFMAFCLWVKDGLVVKRKSVFDL